MEPKAIGSAVPDRRSADRVDTVSPRRRSWTIGIALTALLCAGLVSASFVIQSGNGGASGVQNQTAFLTHWQQTSVVGSVTPNPAPATLSLSSAAPTRLPGGSRSYTLDAAAAGNTALEWTFSETVGIQVNQELEIAVTVNYTLAAVSHTAVVTVFVESQAAAPRGTLTFNAYWDSGVATGITFTSESEISQACAAVGSCP
jgi:hypothetical protein